MGESHFLRVRNLLCALDNDSSAQQQDALNLFFLIDGDIFFYDSLVELRRVEVKGEHFFFGD